MASIKVRARTVDMLGRQQIAGIPTAIHELFKNAYDAYAQTVEVDYFRADNLLVLRDDGYGMSREEFESRWLTIGTESKVGANEFPERHDPVPAGMPRRPIMGEKGIGRLAIAAVGPQVLILTRAGKSKPTSPLVVSLIHWGLFELPGVDLAAIDVPVLELTDGRLPDRKVVKALADSIRQNIDLIGSAAPREARERILRELALADFDVAGVASTLGAPSLGGSNSGTHFYVRPVSPILPDDIDNHRDEQASPLEKMLLGFSNSMTPNAHAATFKAEFRDHREDGVVEELIAGNSFFTPEEFQTADHHVEGQFDRFGQFSGTVAVYDQDPVEHPIAWAEGAGRETECGPFRVSFAYVQGSPRDSRLPSDEWAQISAKLNRIGGLYVYRDGIRVLPYGNSEFDFLGIERRRTKSAQDWYFSYRRIMGAVELTYSENHNLVEKAGREGFRTNLAYRQLVSILENFFERLAIDFFRPTSVHGAEYNAAKAALNREAELLARREATTRRRRQEFADRLTLFFSELEQRKQSDQVDRIVEDVRTRVATVRNASDRDRAAALLLEIEGAARGALKSVVDACTITKPRGLGLSKRLQADWNAYAKNFAMLQENVFAPASDAIFELVSAAGRDVALDNRRLLLSGLESKRQVATNDATKLRREVRERVAGLTRDVDEALQASVSKLSTEIEQTFVELGRTSTSSLTGKQLQSLRSQWERRIDASAEEANAVLEGLRDQLSSLTQAVENKETLDETTGVLEGQVEAYREQLDSYVELAQVGMALGIVQHEFSNSVKSIRNAIRKLKPWVDGTPDLNPVYSDLKSGFEHLEGYLALFTPMSRRLNRAAVDLSGEEIRVYLEEVFGDRLRRHKISMTATDAFIRKSVHGYASTFLPVFVNLVDNAIYWLTTEPGAGRHILLDAGSNGFVVANNGPGVDRRIAERIFDFGETTKPGGRGMGLYLSRQALRKEGYDLTLMKEGSEYPVAFLLSEAEVPGVPS